MYGLSYLKQSAVSIVCDIIESKGFRAYCVGGCVRDAIRGVVAHDYDVTTSALPEQVVDIFSREGCQVVKTGIKHGTVTVIYDSQEFEITTMRSESGYIDSRHPAAVCFVGDIVLDLARRDFTINAIAYSISEDRIIDPYGGVDDICGSLIRCVGDPIVRFDEDALRILRALRFASVLGFELDKDTVSAMRAKKDNIDQLSGERICNELIRMLCGDNAGKIICQYYDILGVFIPHLLNCYKFDQHSPYHSYDVLKHICKVIDNVPPLPHMRLAALFHDIAKPACFSYDELGRGHFYGHAKKSAEIADETMNRLKIDKETQDRALFLVKHHDTPLPHEETLIKKRISKIGIERFRELIDLARADCLGQHSDVHYRLKIYDEIRTMADSIYESSDCLSLSDLAINGYDLMSLGLAEGKLIGDILAALLELVLDGQCDNEHDVLIERAKQYII